jgi:hypothetical protein
MRWLGYIWDAGAWFFLLSIVSAGVIQLVRKCKARGRRLFVDEPNAVLRSLHPDTRIDHRWDA